MIFVQVKFIFCFFFLQTEEDGTQNTTEEIFISVVEVNKPRITAFKTPVRLQLFLYQIIEPKVSTLGQQCSQVWGYMDGTHDSRAINLATVISLTIKLYFCNDFRR